ncbi:uncharacterized protein LOC124703290 [Lolium rigidum]|uniref:uncharacterized protein LOC124703290 n=1 Tax=Lolium rigidum TaxID=89674 RepID=UPI001F5C5B10|nr:uncharacterized protein LOC124703290 [Lolium rigidum]
MANLMRILEVAEVLDRDVLYLHIFFVFAVNELSLMLQEALQANHLTGISLGPECPPIHSLMFADDIIVCGKANMQEVQTISHILDHFCHDSGQTPNWTKSGILFSKNVTMQVKEDIKRIFPASDINSSYVHLGHPLVLPSKDRSAAYTFVYDKFKSKLSTYKANRLSHAARLTLIKSVFSSIPVYYMSNILFSKKFLTKLTAIIRNFWWTGVQNDQTTRSLCLRAWADVCIGKNIGGLGIRNLQATNQGLILSAAWRLAKEPESHLAQILKAKYHHDTSIWRAKPNKPKSAFWSAILKPFAYPAQVKDLWIPGQKLWNTNLITCLFSPTTANTILQTPIINANGHDTLIWKLTPTARNDTLFGRKVCRPSQVFPAANAIIKGTALENNEPARQQGKVHEQEQMQALQTPQSWDANIFARNAIFCDAAWKKSTGNERNQAGLGIIITMRDNQHLKQLHVSALSPPASTPLQAETYGLLLATRIADILQIQEPHFYSDSLVLTLAAKSQTVFDAPGHWENRPLLAAIKASPSFHCNRITHINRSNNVKADHQARLALRICNKSLALRCLSSELGQCPGRDILAVSSVTPFTLLSNPSVLVPLASSVHESAEKSYPGAAAQTTRGDARDEQQHRERPEAPLEIAV